MDEKTKIEPVPYIVYESAQARSERVNKRLTIALVVAIILIFLSNALWLNAWMQYEYVDDCETVTVDAGSGTAFRIADSTECIYSAGLC